MAESPQEFFERRKTIENGLPLDGACYITSLAHKDFKNHIGGRVMIVTKYLAAHSLALETHRLSTREEIEDWKQDQARRRDAILAEQKSRDSSLISPDLLNSISNAGAKGGV